MKTSFTLNDLAFRCLVFLLLTSCLEVDNTCSALPLPENWQQVVKFDNQPLQVCPTFVRLFVLFLYVQVGASRIQFFFQFDPLHH